MAIERGEPWVRDFGDPPELSDAYETWFEEVTTGAAYLDRWEVSGFDEFRDGAPSSLEHDGQRQRLLESTSRARALNDDEDATSVMPYDASENDFLDPPTNDVVLEL